MKRTIYIVLVLVFCLSLVACGVRQVQQLPEENKNDVVTRPVATVPVVVTEPKPVKTQLTNANITSYLIFKAEAYGVSKGDEPLGNERGSGSLSVRVDPKKRGDFEDVTVTLRLKPSHKSWPDKECTIDIPFDGRTEIDERIASYITSYVSTSPSYTVEVVSVTGYFVE